MNPGRNSSLPPHLTVSLTRFAARWPLIGSSKHPDIQSLIREIGKLPSAMISHLDGEIARAANLWHAPSYGIGGRLIQHLCSPDDLMLSRLPETAYLFVFHRDGYVRERALHAIREGLPTAFYVTVLAFRLNDWVPQVRLAAARCADRVLPNTDAVTIAQAALFLLGRRFAWGRWGSEACALDRALSRADVADALADILRDEKDGPMGAILQHASRWEAMDRHLPNLAVNAFQPAVRAGALQRLIEGVARWPTGWTKSWTDKIYGQFRIVRRYDERPIIRPYPLETLIEQGARDRSRAVRKVAATALANHYATLVNSKHIMEILDKDRSAAIRERLDFVRRNAGE